MNTGLTIALLIWFWLSGLVSALSCSAEDTETRQKSKLGVIISVIWFVVILVVLRHMLFRR